ncbi:MAG: hypothetical protein ACD_4C00040G0003 [uncultured bacterium (gcode 4)]|uniref:Uncharacterized protein n=1 Tax=uncultured bacterium (gcode 4) TaxID=1234023 RepID=K2GUX3_9BACT|nr:MAG: hypothetical protein ACD_4C00040G0003 [uncultured bacterium (gcode 4)]
MKTYIKYISSIAITSIVVWSIVYAATSITNFWTPGWAVATVWSGDTIAPAWYQAVNTKLNWVFTEWKWCASVWWTINCVNNAPIDQVWTITDWKWCTGNGWLVTCTSNSPTVTETDPKIWTLTSWKWCKSDWSKVICSSNSTPLYQCPQAAIDASSTCWNTCWWQITTSSTCASEIGQWDGCNNWASAIKNCTLLWNLVN